MRNIIVNANDESAGLVVDRIGNLIHSLCEYVLTVFPPNSAELPKHAGAPTE
jgi:hypothetical protein